MRGEPAKPLNRESPSGGYWFDDLKQAYSYPSYLSLAGEGVTIGVLMTPGFNPPDMKLYFSHENLATPNIQTFNVEGGAPYDVNSAAETQIDIQHSGGMAPKANIILYNLPDLSDDSILAGLTQIIENNVADVVNMSFGEPEAATRPRTTTAWISAASLASTTISLWKVTRSESLGWPRRATLER